MKFPANFHKEKQHSIVNWMINQRTFIEKSFILLVVLSVICIPFVKINYDLSEYLPDWAPSKAGLNLMEEEFGYPGTARIMIGPVSIYEAKVYRDRIAHIDGVDMVMWADSKADVYQSNLFIQYDDITDYYKDEYACMDVTFVDGDSDESTHQAISEIQEMLGEKGYFTGSAVQNKSLSETLTREIALAMVMGVIMIFIILTLTTTSWFEPILFLTIMGVAILINMGTNIFLGTISFLTFSVAAILQLAIAMDYSIFLLHTFTHEKEAGAQPEQAIANALHSAFTSIMSSGATTIVGFVVLALMNFTIGRDLGIVLAKGIVISLATVLIFMPALILRWAPYVEKTAHKSFMPSFRPLGNFIYKFRVVPLIFVLIFVIPAYVAQGMNSFEYGNDSLGSSEGTKVYDDEQEINRRFGRSNLILAIVPNTNQVTEKTLSDAIEDLPYVKSVTSLANTLPAGVPEHFMPESVTELLHSKDYARIMIYVRSANESEFAFQCSDEIQAIIKEYYPENASLVGVTPSTQDIKEIITDDYNFVNILSLLGVALVVMLTFKSGIIPLVVLVPIEVAIFLNMALPYLLGDKMIFMGYIIVSCLQLGATVDYSILLTNNYLDNRTQLDKKSSAILAISSSALSILTSGLILTIVGYGLFFVSSVSAIAGIGRLVGRGALFSMVLVLGLLPILLMLMDKMIFDQKKRLERFENARQARTKQFIQSARSRRLERRKRLKALFKKSHKKESDKAQTTEDKVLAGKTGSREDGKDEEK